MNTALLLKIKRLFKDEPKRLDMYAWAYGKEGSTGPKCGTVACIGGWACILNQEGESMRERLESLEWGTDFYSRAKRHLKINDSQAHRLFYTEEWPEDLDKAYNGARKPAQKVAAVVARIDRFIKTGGRE